MDKFGRMNTEQAIVRLTEVIRRKHLALNTEQSYCAHAKQLPAHLPSEQKVEQFLTALAKTGIAASTQNQAFNAIIFFPANQPCADPRTGKLVRWRLHEANIQRAIRKACRKTGSSIL